MFYILWTTAPILISIVSFLVFVLQGNELTVAKAFTVSLVCHSRCDCADDLECNPGHCLVHYDTVRFVEPLVTGFLNEFYLFPRQPLNILPAWIVQILQVLFLAASRHFEL
jgi:hypothetical protein